MKKQSKLRSMKKRRRMALLTVVAWIAFALVAALAIVARSTDESQTFAVQVTPAALSPEGKAGEAAFNATCAECHGENAAGTTQGPPLIHDIYNPGHHSDEAFYLAVATGSRQHHWTFGDMPAQPDVSREEVTKIIRYIREVQETNGIVTKGY